MARICQAAGGIVWAGIYTLAAYLAGNALKQASGIITWTLVAAAAAAIAAVLIWARRKTSKLAARAEAAYPGPLEQ